jgi:hypothetical protein
MTLRDPRLGLSTAMVGSDASAPLALGTRLELALPLGEARALAGAPGPTLAPAFTLAFDTGRLALGLDLGLRLRRAVAFASVREGSEVVTAAGVGFTLLEQPVLAVALESFLRVPLASPPVGAGGDRNLPAEWLLSARFLPYPGASWSLEGGAGTGLPLSRARPDGEPRSTLGVTAPRLRVLAAFRYSVAPR